MADGVVFCSRVVILVSSLGGVTVTLEAHVSGSSWQSGTWPESMDRVVERELHGAVARIMDREEGTKMVPWDVLLFLGLAIFVWSASRRVARGGRRLRDSSRVGLLAGSTRSSKDQITTEQYRCTINNICRNGHRIPIGTWCYQCEREYTDATSAMEIK